MTSRSASATGTGANGRCPPRADAGDGLQPAVVRNQFEAFERFHLQFVVDALGKAMTESRYGSEQLHRVGAAAQALELRPAPGPHHFDQSRGDTPTDVG